MELSARHRWTFQTLLGVVLAIPASARHSPVDHHQPHSPGSTLSRAYSVGGGQQAGQATVGGLDSHSVWSGSAASWVSLNPAGSTQSAASRSERGAAGGLRHDRRRRSRRPAGRIGRLVGRPEPRRRNILTRRHHRWRAAGRLRDPRRRRSSRFVDRLGGVVGKPESRGLGRIRSGSGARRRAAGGLRPDGRVPSLVPGLWTGSVRFVDRSQPRGFDVLQGPRRKDGGRQVGQAYFGGVGRASLWRGIGRLVGEPPSRRLDGVQRPGNRAVGGSRCSEARTVRPGADRPAPGSI